MLGSNSIDRLDFPRRFIENRIKSKPDENQHDDRRQPRMNQTWVGLTMIIAGFSLAMGGVAVLLGEQGRSTASTLPLDELPVLAPAATPEVVARDEPLSSEEKGRKCEEWVVKHFRRDVFEIKEWRGDKFVDGIHAESSTYPDLEVELHLRDARERFAVECKWRGGWEVGAKPFLYWATDQQISNYQGFAQARKLPVFVVLGLGGRPDDPSEVFIVPLDKLRFAAATEEYLTRFRRKSSPGQNFFFDPKIRELR